VRTAAGILVLNSLPRKVYANLETLDQMPWLIVAVLTLALGATSARADTASTVIGTSVIGTSQTGASLVLYQLGSGPKKVLILGGQHGGPEANTVELVDGLLDYFEANPSEIPSAIELDMLPVANPDGLTAGSRQFVSGVDPNRNWGGSDWRADAFDSNGVLRVGLGGPEPFSEPETQALANWILSNRPVFVANYHSAGGFMFGGRDGEAGDLSAAYAQASGYAWPSPGVSGQSSPLSYQATGSMNAWLRQIGIAAVLVELTTPRSTEIERNLAGLTAVLNAIQG
jgi:protein MpaA